MNSNYFFLYLKTGGGHLAPASSVRSYLKSRYPDLLEPVLVDGLAEAPRAFRSCIEDGYKTLQAYGRWFYALLYFLNKWRVVGRLNVWIVACVVRPYLERRILAEMPGKIVIFHFFLIKPIHDILREHKLSIPTLVVVTDPFTAHPLWFVNRGLHYVVFSEQLRGYCVGKGIPTEHITVFPFVLSEKFAGSPSCAESPEELKQGMGFDPGKKLILMIGGADGMPKGTRIVRELLRKNPSAQIAVVCGRNEVLRRRLLMMGERLGSSRLTVFGFVDSVCELLRCADLVVTKCGASTFMETLLSGKIPIVNNYLWEQEKGNVEFLRQNHFGIYEKNIGRLSSWIDQLFNDSALFASFSHSIERAQLVNGVGQVSDYIVRYNSV